MRITKKWLLPLFAIVISLFLVNNVSAESVDVYTIDINVDGNMTTTRTNGDSIKNDYSAENGIYNIDSGKIVYNSNTGELTVSKGVVIDQIKSEKDLIITTNNEEAYIDKISVGNKTDADLYIKDAKLSFSGAYSQSNAGYDADNILIQKSTINVSELTIEAIHDLFVENSDIKANGLFTRGTIKVADSKFEGRDISTSLMAGCTEDGMNWKTSDKYVFKGDNENAFYGNIISNSEITFVGSHPSGIFSYKGILIENSKITDKGTYDSSMLKDSIKCYGVAGYEPEITINNSELNIKAQILTHRNVDVVINESTINSESNISMWEGTLKINDSIVNFKNYIAPGNKDESPIGVNGDIIITKSRVNADASSTNGKVVGIAYTGKIVMDSSAVALNKKGDELIKDIDISDITYNQNILTYSDKIYTIGLKNSDGSISGIDSDYTTIGDACTITISIEDGTWADGTTDDIVIKKIVGDTLTESDLPTGMKSNDGITTGSWNVAFPTTVTKDMNITYQFEIENPETSDNILLYVTLVLMSLISLTVIKTLKKRYN